MLETEYKKKLVTKFGVCTLRGVFKTVSAPVLHACNSCTKLFNVTPQSMLRYKAKPICTSCERKEEQAHVQTPRQVFVNKLQALLPNVRVVKFVSAKKRSAFKCKCGKTWKAKPDDVLNYYVGCPKCNKEVRRINFCSTKQVGFVVKTLIKGFTPSIEPIDVKYLGSSLRYVAALKKKNTYVGVSSLKDFVKHLGFLKAVRKAYTSKNKTFRFVVIHGNKAIELPKDWSTLNDTEVVNYVNSASLEDTLHILALDPGNSNFGWAVLEVTNKFKVSIKASGLIRFPVKTLTRNTLIPQLKRYKNEIQDIINEYRVDRVIAERFMTRGLKGTTIELVSIMIAIATTAVGWKSDNIILIPAAQWKNEFNKRWNLEEYYTKVECVDHQVDAVMIGLYGAHTWFNEKPFSKINPVKLVRSINLSNLGRDK